ncbi:HD-GYP domain-containing protein [Thioalkalivibrio sp. ALE20]|uniref:HD-GYP domain-containing protein n=1 Tax=Thioalkalivibrio sp. ALE20 TaxID=545275 RepID=UPI00035DDD6C|nr:HD domain-containing phosphohydrolase [Thioalkalivibrio sp. ALE20]
MPQRPEHAGTEEHGGPPDTAHFVTHVTEAGEVRDMRTSEAIYNAHGQKLIEAGQPLDRRLFERLTTHKLLRPLDASIDVAEPVDRAALRATSERVAEEDPLTRALMAVASRPREAVAVPSSLTLDPALAGKLSILQERMPEAFEHAVQVSLGATLLGMELRPPDTAFARDLATAGLFHDIGYLHIDPAIFESRAPLTPEQERQLRSHPVIAWLTLKRFPACHPGASHAVLQHHERLDGSGYPRGHAGETLEPAGRCLAVMELASALCGRQDPAALSAILKGHAGQLDGDALRVLLQAMDHCPVAESAPQETGSPVDWEALRAGIECVEQGLERMEQLDPASQAILRRHLEPLTRLLDRAGLRGLSLDLIRDSIAQDASLRVETAALQNDVRYRLRLLARELPDTDEELPEALRDWARRLREATG